jgi:hypothetical protein
MWIMTCEITLFILHLEFRMGGYDQGSFVPFFTTLQLQKHKAFGYI